MGNLHEDPSGLLPGGSARHNEASRGLKRNDPVGNLGKDPSGLPLDGPTSAQAGAVPYDSCPTEHIQHRSSHALHGPANRACVTAEVPPLLRWLREQRCEFAYVTLQHVGCIELDDLRHFRRKDLPWANEVLSTFLPSTRTKLLDAINRLAASSPTPHDFAEAAADPIGRPRQGATRVLFSPIAVSPSILI